MKATLSSVVVLAALGLGALPAAAKTCKEPLSVQSRSTIKQDEAGRAKRATETATKKWGEAAKAKYGFAYRFWLRAENSKTDCRHTPKSTTCTVTATPCRLI